MRHIFIRLATITAQATGHWAAFVVAVATVLLWAVAGPIFHWSSTWQLTINTGTTIITFLLVFIIQATQNRDTTAVHIKLDAIAFALSEVDNRVIGIETEEDPDEAVTDPTRTTTAPPFASPLDPAGAPQAKGVPRDG